MLRKPELSQANDGAVRWRHPCWNMPLIRTHPGPAEVIIEKRIGMEESGRQHSDKEKDNPRNPFTHDPDALPAWGFGERIPGTAGELPK